MNLEQIREELEILEGIVLQKAIDESDGTGRGIRKALRDMKEEGYNDEDFTLVNLIEQAEDTLEWELYSFKPFN